MYERDRHTDRQTHGHRMTAKAALDASIARQKPLLLQIMCRSTFWSTTRLSLPITSFCGYQPVSDVLIDVASSNVLRFHKDKIDIVSLVALHLPKIMSFYRCVQLLQSKTEGGPV